MFTLNSLLFYLMQHTHTHTYRHTNNKNILTYKNVLNIDNTIYNIVMFLNFNSFVLTLLSVNNSV